jgi:hypothetical protein
MDVAAALAEVLNSVTDRADRPKLPVGRACTRLEKIKLLRESLNSIAAAQALNQNAVAEVGAAVGRNLFHPPR